MPETPSLGQSKSQAGAFNLMLDPLMQDKSTDDVNQSFNAERVEDKKDTSNNDGNNTSLLDLQ